MIFQCKKCSYLTFLPFGLMDLQFTGDYDTIISDFGHFPQHFMRNPHGLFHKETHMVSLYMGTNNGLYWSCQCLTKGCPYYGHLSIFDQCLSLQGVCKTASSDRNMLIRSLLNNGFEYQTIHNQYGIFTY